MFQDYKVKSDENIKVEKMYRLDLFKYYRSVLIQFLKIFGGLL